MASPGLTLGRVAGLPGVDAVKRTNAEESCEDGREVQHIFSKVVHVAEGTPEQDGIPGVWKAVGGTRLGPRHWPYYGPPCEALACGRGCF